jgi:hypothetical protein
MRTVRRIYFYAVALISLEVVIWGVIGLIRTIISQQIDSGIAGLLASGLSQIIVAIPIFLLHWLIAQHEADRDEEERASQVRALFHYAARLALLIPVIQNFLALLNRQILLIFDVSHLQALVGSGQTNGDNISAILVNLLAFAYLSMVLKKDWQIFPADNSLVPVRRLYRVVWMLYNLALTVTGVIMILRFILFIPESYPNVGAITLANGLALTIVGLPLWLFAWQNLAASRDQQEDKKSILCLVSIYLLTLIGVITVLITGTGILTNLISYLTLDGRNLTGLINDTGSLLAAACVFGVIWVFFHRQLQIEFNLLDDPALIAGLQRIYIYILSLLGAGATFAGLQQLLSFLVHYSFELMQNLDAFRSMLSRGLAVLIVGTPLWLLTWPKAQADARAEDDRGDHARRSPIRKGYLYFVLFLTVVGAMVTAGQVFYQLISLLLGNENENFLVDILNWFQSFLLVLVFLIYHLRVLRQDGRMYQKALTKRHAEYPVLLLANGQDETLTEIGRKFSQHLPDLPFKLVDISQQKSLPQDLPYRAVVMSAALFSDLPDWLHRSLNDFTGKKIVLPQEAGGWLWLGSGQRAPREQVNDAVTTIRQLAEGQTVRTGQTNNPWIMIGYILGALFGLQLLLVIVSIVVSSFG